MAPKHGSKLRVIILYQECLRNHLVEEGSRVLDGCCSYDPSGPDGMSCAACGCHQNFHKMVFMEMLSEYAAPGHISGTAGTGGEEEGNAVVAQVPETSSETSPWRRRITPEQSEEIRSVVHANNWKMFRDYSSEEVEQSCTEIGIPKLTFKSWISTHRRQQRVKNEDLA